jgi:hypothetical protein
VPRNIFGTMFNPSSKPISQIGNKALGGSFGSPAVPKRRVTDPMIANNFGQPASVSMDATRENSDIINFPDAPITICAFRDSDGVLDSVQQGEFLMALESSKSVGEKKFAKVLPFQVINQTLYDSFQRDTIANSGKNARDLSQSKKRPRTNDLMGAITNGKCHTVEQFNQIVTLLGPTVAPGKNHVMAANKLGAQLGLKALLYQARGRAIVPNLWGDIQLGDKVGFIIKKFQNNTFTSGDGMSSARSKTTCLMILPCINHLGRNTINNIRHGRSTLVGNNNRSLKPENREASTGRYETLAERCSTGSDMNPKTMGKTFVDFEVVETVDYEGRVSYIGTPVVKTGQFYHLGTVYKRGSSPPTLSSILAAVVPGMSGMMGMQAAYRDLQIKHSMELMIEPHRTPCFTDASIGV